MDTIVRLVIVAVVCICGCGISGRDGGTADGGGAIASANGNAAEGQPAPDTQPVNIEAAIAGLTEPASVGLPSKLRDLTDQRLLRDAKVSGPQTIDVLVVWLAREVAAPSPTSIGLGGGHVTTAWIQGQLALAMWNRGDTMRLRQIQAERTTLPAAVKAGLSIALGIKGDETQIPELVKTLRESSGPYLRAYAARALGALAAVETQEALRLALDDPYSATFPAPHRPGFVTIYPVRDAALGALRMIEREPQTGRAKARRESFKRATAEEQK